MQEQFTQCYFIYPGWMLKSFCTVAHIKNKTVLSRVETFSYKSTAIATYWTSFHAWGDVRITLNGFWQTYSRIGFPANSILQPATSATRLLQCLSFCFPFSSSIGWAWGRKYEATTPIKVQPGEYIASSWVRYTPLCLGIKTCSLQIMECVMEIPLYKRSVKFRAHGGNVHDRCL